MLDRLFLTVSPHLCMYCLRVGALICDHCKSDIVRTRVGVCVVCGDLNGGQLCDTHTQPYQQVWCFGERKDAIKYLIDELKLQYKREAAQHLGYFLNAAIPALPKNTIIVPVPTTAHHKRLRGFDHTLLLAKYIAKARKLPLKRVITRDDKAAQRLSNKSDRLRQAQQAYTCTYPLDPDKTYLIIDDVVTTGATIRYAAKALKKAGARHICVAVIAYEPLD